MTLICNDFCFGKYILKWLTFFIIGVQSLCDFGYAQSECSFATLVDGPEQKEIASEVRQILGKIGNQVFMVKRVSRMGAEIHLCISNQNGVETLDNEIKLEKFDGHSRNIDFFVMLKEKLWVFSTHTDKKTDNFILTCQEINSSTLQLVGSPKFIASTIFKRKKDKGYFNFEKSTDGTKFLVYGVYPDNEDPGIEVQFKVFDANLDLLWEKSETIGLSGKYATIKEFIITNSGKTYLTTCEFPDKKSMQKQSTSNYSYRFYKFEKEVAMKEFSVEVPEKFIVDLKIRFESDDKLSCVGFYSNLPQRKGDAGLAWFPKKESARGVFNLNLDENGNALSSNKSDFPIEFIVEGETESKKKKLLRGEDEGDEAELTEFDIRETVTAHDGGTYVIAEQFYITVNSTAASTRNTIGVAGGIGSPMNNTTNMNGTTTMKYFFNDIIIVKIKQTGEIEWARKVRKKQFDSTSDQNTFHSTLYPSQRTIQWLNSRKKPNLFVSLADNGGKHCSFINEFHNNKIYLFFNDNPKNSDPSVDLTTKVERMGKGSDIAFTAVEIDEAGNVKREIPINQAKRESALIMPVVNYSLASDEILLVGDKRKKFQYFTLKIK